MAEVADRILALRTHWDEWESEVNVRHIFECWIGSKRWLVLTDTEANEECYRQLVEAVDEHLEIPTWIRPYFNSDKWIADEKDKGRAYTLARFDEQENVVEIEAGKFFIYRVN